MDFDLEKVGDVIRKLLEALGIQPPEWLLRLAGIGALSVTAAWGLLYALTKIKALALEVVTPWSSPEKRDRLLRRRRFAAHIAGEIERLNREQSWSDFRFTELEAEVEAEGHRRERWWMISRSEIRRERSLSRALDRSQERLILLEGDPGSGKSVALRHVALDLARRARRRGFKTVIPLYINLKEIDRTPGTPVDRALIQDFAMKALNRVHDRDVDAFLQSELRSGMLEGAWLFLFDSFDEIPEILGSTEPDAAIQQYTRAIEDFLHGMNRCRGVLASRSFRGPGGLAWPRFRIQPLTPKQRVRLVLKTNLPRPVQQELLERLPAAAEQMGGQLNNPLFLGLICEHMEGGRPFPESGYAVFESYIERRLRRDAERIRQRHGRDVETVRRIAEQVAFCMSADAGLGLSPARERIAKAMVRQGFEASSLLPDCLDALELIKLGHAEDGADPAAKLFTFAHRRIQEYFATCLALASPGRVPPRRLLLDGRWRETAIVICQTAPPEALMPLIDEASRFLAGLQYPGTPPPEEPLPEIREFPWPPGALHVLGLLQDGFAGRMETLPQDLRERAGRLMIAADLLGTLADRRWALEVCGACDEESSVSVVRSAFRHPSQWLAEVAFRQAGRLTRIAGEVSWGIHAAIVRLFVHGRLRREYRSLATYLARLERPQRFLGTLRLVRHLRKIDLALHLAVFFLLLSVGMDLPPDLPPDLHPAALWFITLLVLSVLAGSWQSLAWIVRKPLEIHAIRHGSLLFRDLLEESSRFRKAALWMSEMAVGILLLAAARLGLAYWVVNFMDIEGLWERMLAAFLSGLTMVWAPMAIWAAERGVLTRPLAWPVLSFSPFLILFRLLRLARWRAAMVAVGIFLALALTWLISLPSDAVLEAVKRGANGEAFPWVLAALAVPVVWLTYDFVRDILRWSRMYLGDYRRYRRHRSRVLSTEDLLPILFGFRSNEFRALFLRRVWERSLLPKGPEAEACVAGLALAVERAFDSGDSEDARLPGQDLRTWSPEALDELYRLREYLRTELPSAAFPPEKLDEVA